MFFFLLTSGYFSILIFSSCLLHKSPIVSKLGGARPALRRVFAWSGYILSTPSEWIRGFLEVSLARRFRTPEGIARRVPGVWVIYFLTYFSYCPFFLNTPNYRSPSADQLIFMSRNGNSLSVTIWTLSYFAGVGDLPSVVYIYAVNLRCWFPAALFTVWWNSSSQSLILLTYFFPLNTTMPSSL